MNRYLIAIAVSAFMVILTASPALAGATCNCAAQTCTSGGTTWPISSCSECNGVCGSSSSSSAATRPVDTTFLRNNYNPPVTFLTTPLDTGRVLPPADLLAALLKGERERLLKERENAEKVFNDARKRWLEAKQKLQEAYELVREKEREEVGDLPFMFLLDDSDEFKKAEAEFKKAEAEEQAAKQKEEEARKKFDNARARVESLLKESNDEDKKAAEEARKEKLVEAAKEKLAAMKNRAEAEDAVKKAETKAAEKRAAEEKAWQKAAEARMEAKKFIEIAVILAIGSMSTDEKENDTKYNELTEEVNKLEWVQRMAEDDLSFAKRQREQADEEAAAMGEAARQLGYRK